MSASDNLFGAVGGTSVASPSSPMAEVSSTPSTSNNPLTQPHGGLAQAPETQNQAENWFYAENMPGQGPKPDYFIDSKYKTVEEQAKGYNELRKKLGGFTGAPEKYDLDISKLGEQYKEIQFNNEDQALNAFMDMAKKSNMSQDQFTQILKYKADLDIARSQEESSLISEYQKEQLGRLGDNVKERLSTLEAWWKQNFSEYPIEKMQEQAMSADFIEMLETIKSKFRYNPVPNEQANVPRVTRDEARAMLNDPKYMSDMDYRRKVDAIYSQFTDKK